MDETIRTLGREPGGFPALRRASGQVIHVGAQKQVQLELGDTMIFTSTFDTARGGSGQLLE
ncbi:MAG: hypothetical protein BZ151_08880 [Desulfobacca sp. 4484_104]|nr:MAG: hypothetical protein BZ151_08880 [Desulfobacca sp. 4484_104]